MLVGRESGLDIIDSFSCISSRIGPDSISQASASESSRHGRVLTASQLEVTPNNSAYEVTRKIKTVYNWSQEDWAQCLLSARAATK